MLLSGRCEVFGLEESEAPSFVARSNDEPLVCVVGRPPASAVAEAVSLAGDGCVVLVQIDDGDWMAEAFPDWSVTRAVLHLPGDDFRPPDTPEGSARLIEASELELVEGPDETLFELRLAARRGLPVAAAFEGGRPVSFCYPAARTETLWDLSIDILEEFRRRGHAARCASCMIGHMEPLRPVWGAEETNPTSLKLAESLGFVVVDELLVFRP